MVKRSTRNSQPATRNVVVNSPAPGSRHLSFSTKGRPCGCGLITLTTDFGLEGEYVGALKGVIVSVNPACRIIDITHRIAPQNILQAAFVLKGVYRYYPQGTIHLAVVDPGVGTRRKPVIIKKDGHIFVGPDNGIFTLILKGKGKSEGVEITAEKYFLTPLSSTFHGRDLFAPVAAHLSRGEDLKNFGPRLKDFVRIEWPHPEMKRGRISGKILWADGFGNLITNIDRNEYAALLAGKPISIKGPGWEIQRLIRTYGEARTGQPIALFGSSDLLEIAVSGGDARQTLGFRPGDRIEVDFRVDMSGELRKSKKER